MAAGGLAAVEAFVASLGLDAYVVGGVVRDELLGRPSKDADFLVAGLSSAELAERLSAHGRVEELVVAGAAVGVRLYPRGARLRALAPAGIEFAPLRRERSTGPGRHDFEIVVDPGAAVADDLARRDFTVNAIARRLADGELVDPFDGRGDLERGVLRAVGPRSLAEDPLRILRGLRLVSELGLEPEPETLAGMREHAAAIALVSGERIGGGLTADGSGELSRLLAGARPEQALTIARDTGALVAMLPEYAAVLGVRADDADELTLDEHMLRVVQRAADAGAPLRVRLAALLHDLGKAPGAAGADHAARGAALAGAALDRLRYPAALRDRVVAIVRFHTLRIGDGGALEARRLLARHGEELAFDLVDHRLADLSGKGRAGARDPGELARLVAFRAQLEAERESPHRLADLAVDGNDLVELGFAPGPQLGEALATLLAEVVDEPGRNRREPLLARAAELLGS